MSAILYKVLLAGYKFMPEMHLKQSRFTYNECGSFTKNEETGDSRCINKTS